jgi:hypothetical protein
MPYLFELLALTLASLLVCYIIGIGVLRLLRMAPQEPLFEGFIRLLTGLAVLIIGYAIFRTHGVTVLLPLPLLLVGALYGLRPPAVEAPSASTPSSSPTSWTTLAIVLGMSAVALVVQYLLVYEPGTPFLQTPFEDYVFYSRLTLPLTQLGVETNSLEMVFPQFQTVQPYHYFEIWATTLLVDLTGLPSVWVNYVATTAIISGICGLGFAAIYAHSGLPRRWAVLLGVVTLAVTGTSWPFLLRFPFFGNGTFLSHMPLYLYPKLTPIYLFMLLGALLVLRRQFHRAALAFAALPLVFVSTAAAVALGVGGLALWLWLNREVSLKRAFTIVLPVGLILAFMAAFYLLQPEAYHFPVMGRSLQVSAILPPRNELKFLPNIAIGVVINYLVSFAGYLVLILVLLFWRTRGDSTAPVSSFWRGMGPLLAWFGATLAGGILMRTAGHHYIDGFQFFSNPIIPLSAVVLAVVLGRLLNNASTPGVVLTLAVFLVLAGVNSLSDKTKNTHFSRHFLEQARSVLRTLPNRGGYLLGEADYENVFQMSSDSHTAGAYVSNFKNNYLLLSLSALIPDSLQTDPRYARDSAQATIIKRRSTLYRLLKLRDLAKRPVPPDSAALALVRRAGLAFVCASPLAVLPSSLRPLVRASYRDATSGEILYVLNPLVSEYPIKP